MPSPIQHTPEPNFNSKTTTRSSEEEQAYFDQGSVSHGQPEQYRVRLATTNDSKSDCLRRSSPSQPRDQDNRVADDLTLLQAERVVSNSRSQSAMGHAMSKSRSRREEPIDHFDVDTNPAHERNSIYRPPVHPSTKFARVFKKIHNSSFLIRYFTYITPVVVVLLIPLLLGAFIFKEAAVGGVSLMWFSVWLEIFWLMLWAGRIVAKMIPWPLGLISSLFTNNSKKWRDLGKQLEVPATIFFWALGVEVAFLPIMQSHQVSNPGDTSWMATVNRVIISLLVGATLNFVEKIIIQLIAISFHLRTYADRIELNKFQIQCLVKLYKYSKEKIAMTDSDFEDHDRSGPGSGTRTPKAYLELAQRNVADAFTKVGDVAGVVAGDFTGRKVAKSTHPHQVILMLLHSTSASQVLARRLYRTFVHGDEETLAFDDMKLAFGDEEEASAAFTMFDKDLNGDISMEELEAVCVEIGRERKSITASLKDLDSVVSKLDSVLLFVVVCITILVFLTLISTSAAGVLTSAGSTVLALSWLFSATAQEFLQSVIFVFVKHPFDVGDRVSIYGNTGALMKGDDYFVKEISLLFTEFKKMEGHVVQAPNSYLNTLFILNMRRSGALAEAVPITVKFGTTMKQFEELRNQLLEFVKGEKREYQGNILTEIRDVVEAHSINLNVVFFYKSNWQNELLRLQRRNKFICALMVTMQELGIEGPRMRIAGQQEDAPLYVQYPSTRNHEMNSETNSSNPLPGSPNCETASVPNVPRMHGSIPRQPSTTTTLARGESISAMSKRVDFSLGMKDARLGDMMGDLSEDDRKPRLPDYNRIPLGEELSQERLLAPITSSDTRSISSRFSMKRSRTNSQTQSRDRAIHRNRFFSRRGRPSLDGADDSMMEQGMADIPESRSSSTRLKPRTGVVGSGAIQTSTDNEKKSLHQGGYLSQGERAVGKAPTQAATQEFEMSGM